MSDERAIAPVDWRPPIYRVRGQAVILDSDLARALGMETKRLNESIRRHADLVDDRHCFTMTDEEFAALRSQLATPNPGRGGRQYAPRVFTDRGVARVATFINTPEAMRATDLIIDTFMTVHKQIAAGRRRIEIEQPSRYQLGDDVAEQSRKLRGKLIGALDRLLDTVIDIRSHQTVREAGKELTAGALESIRERLREKGLENLKLEAETRRVLAEAERIAAEVRRADAETEGIRLDNLTKRIRLVRDLTALQRELEPPQLVQLLGTFDADEAIDLAEIQQPDAPRRLPAPRDGDE